MTRDCQLICRHEPDLLATTDAETKFPDLVKNYTIDSTLSGTVSRTPPDILPKDSTALLSHQVEAVLRLLVERAGNSGKRPDIGSGEEPQRCTALASHSVRCTKRFQWRGTCQALLAVFVLIPSVAVVSTSGSLFT